MTEKTFDIFVDKTIIPAIRDTISSLSSRIAEYDIKLNTDTNNQISDDEIALDESLKERILLKYDKYRKFVRSNYFDVGTNQENKIDIHKICACLTAAIIDTRLFKYNIHGTKDLSVFLSNYTVAFLFGMHMLYLNLIDEYRCMSQNGKDDEEKKVGKRILDILEQQKTLKFPKTNPGHDPYLQGRVKTLALNDIYRIEFDLLTYADMLFWIEKYNKDLLLRKIGKQVD